MQRARLPVGRDDVARLVATVQPCENDGPGGHQRVASAGGANDRLPARFLSHLEVGAHGPVVEPVRGRKAAVQLAEGRHAVALVEHVEPEVLVEVVIVVVAHDHEAVPGPASEETHGQRGGHVGHVLLDLAARLPPPRRRVGSHRHRVFGGAEACHELEVGDVGEGQRVERPARVLGDQVIEALVALVHRARERAARGGEPVPEGMARPVLRHLRAVEQPEAPVRHGGVAFAPVVVAVPGPGLAGADEVDALGAADAANRGRHRMVARRVRVEVRVRVAVRPAELPQRQPRLETNLGFDPGVGRHLERVLLRDEVDAVVHLERITSRGQRQVERAVLAGEDTGQVLVLALHRRAGRVPHDHARRQRGAARGVEDAYDERPASRAAAHDARRGGSTRRRSRRTHKQETGDTDEREQDGSDACGHGRSMAPPSATCARSRLR